MTVEFFNEDNIKHFTINSKPSKFKQFLDDLLGDIYGYGKKRAFDKTIDSVLYFHYLAFGTTFNYAIYPSGDTLDIYLSLSYANRSDDDVENVGIHIEHITREMNKKFPIGSLPLSFHILILDEAYLRLMKERWEESILTEKAEAHLATVVLLGSILEAMLLYKITSNWVDVQISGHYPKIFDKPTNKLVIKPSNQWMLNEMIDSSEKIGWISHDIKGLSHSLKEYRNFIHPWQELSEKMSMPDETTCDFARKAVQIVFNDLLRNSA